MTKIMLLAGALAFFCGVLGAMGYSYAFGPKSGKSSSNEPQAENGASRDRHAGAKKESSKTEKQGSEQESTGPSANSIPGFTSAEDSQTLKKQIMDLMQRVDRLSVRIDTLSRPRDETPPVLRTMQIKIGELSRAMDELAELPAQVRQCTAQLMTLKEQFKILRARNEGAGGGALDRETSADGIPKRPGSFRGQDVDGPAESPTLKLAMSLLERAQYASAREMLQRLQLAEPDDARVWYLSALASGLTNGDWTGEAKKLAEKGIACERAGNPSTATIDAALAMPTPIRGADWLASLRRNVLGAARKEN